MSRTFRAPARPSAPAGRRSTAAGAAVSLIGGLLFAGPAIATDSAAVGENTVPSTAASTSKPSPGSEMQGTESGSTDTDLEAALERDLQMSPEEFEHRGTLADQAAEALPRLEKIDGFVSIALSSGSPAHLKITGTGAKLQAAADELDAVLAPPEAAASDAADRSNADDPSASAAPGKGQQEEDSGAQSTEAPAATAPANTDAAPAASVQEILAGYVDLYGPAGLGHLQAIMQDASGQYMIRMAEPAGGHAAARATAAAPSSDALTDLFSNVEVDAADGPAEPLADDVLVGGLGIVPEGDGFPPVCSMGFNAYTPEGGPAIVSAGHCTEDSRYTEVSLIDPRTEPAASADNSYYPAAESLTDLGQFRFSQFGGVNNTAAPEGALDRHNNGQAPLPDATGTDVSVIESLRADLIQLPAVTDWENPDDISSTGPLVTATMEPTFGASACASGRTTGWSCGTIDYIGIFFVAGPNYFLDRTDVRVVEGYGSEGIVSAGGDSGGPHISGTRALGVTSAGGRVDGVEMTYAAGIGPMLAATGGYTLQVFVEAPELIEPVDGAAVETGNAVHGTAQAGNSITVTSGGTSLPVEVDADGSWTFNAPQEAGVLEFSVQASSGYSQSESRSYTLLIEEPAPVVQVDDGAAGGNSAAGDGGAAESEQESATSFAAAGYPARLPETGAAGLLPLTAGAAILLAGGVCALALSRRRPVSDSR